MTTGQSSIQVEDLTDAQRAGQACRLCHSDEAPLHPAGTATVEDPTPGVAHDYEVVLCTRCLVERRYQAALLPADEKGRVLWGIRDWACGGAWVKNGDETERHTLECGAKDWIRRQRYLNESATFRA